MQNNETIENVVELEKPSLIGLIMNPSEQFERIRKNPKIFVALIVVTIMTIVAALLSLQGMDEILEQEMVGVSEEELMIFTIATQITIVVMATFTPAIIILISSGIYMLIAKIVQSDVTFKQMFSLFVYVSFITALGGLINGFFSMFVTGSNPNIPLTSLNSIVGAEGVLGVIFSTIEVFSIWGLVLTAIGLQIVAKFSKGLAWGTVIAFFIITLGFAIGATMLGEALGV